MSSRIIFLYVNSSFRSCRPITTLLFPSLKGFSSVSFSMPEFIPWDIICSVTLDNHQQRYSGKTQCPHCKQVNPRRVVSEADARRPSKSTRDIEDQRARNIRDASIANIIDVDSSPPPPARLPIRSTPPARSTTFEQFNSLGSPHAEAHRQVSIKRTAKVDHGRPNAASKAHGYRHEQRQPALYGVRHVKQVHSIRFKIVYATFVKGVYGLKEWTNKLHTS